MRLSQSTINGLVSNTAKALFSGGLVVAITASVATQTAHAFPHYNDWSGNKSLQVAGPLDKSSPKIAHGMYRDRGKSSPKIAHGMYRDRGKSSPKIAHGMYRDRGKSSPKIAHRTRRGPAPSLNPLVTDMVDLYFEALDAGDLELADAVGRRVDALVGDSGYARGR